MILITIKLKIQAKIVVIAIKIIIWRVVAAHMDIRILLNRLK